MFWFERVKFDMIQ